MIQSALDFFAPPCGHSQSDVQRALDVIRLFDYAFAPGFAVWLKDNWEIWAAFEREADKIWGIGRRTYSARTIIEVIRHHTALRDGDSMFKINNNRAPDLARLYMDVHPERDGFFETRVLPGSVRQA